MAVNYFSSDGTFDYYKLDFVVGMGKNWLTQWSTERMFTLSSGVLLLQSRQQSCLLRNENIIIFI